MPFVTCMWNNNDATDAKKSTMTAGIQKAMREVGGVKAPIHVGYIDADYAAPLLQVWWTERPAEVVEATNAALYEELKGCLTEEQVLCVIFTDIKRGSFGANGEILNGKPDPSRGIY